MFEVPTLMVGKKSGDARGEVSFINDFHFHDVKRFYQVTNSADKPIRAFHGHMREAKYVYVAMGEILLCAVHLTDSKIPSREEKVYSFHLSASEPSVVYIPPAYANGFKSLSIDAKVIFFSTASLEDSVQDDFRFAPDYWGNKIWEI